MDEHPLVPYPAKAAGVIVRILFSARMTPRFR
jgi:hypothetical protein